MNELGLHAHLPFGVEHLAAALQASAADPEFVGFLWEVAGGRAELVGMVWWDEGLKWWRAEGCDLGIEAPAVPDP